MRWGQVARRLAAVLDADPGRVRAALDEAVAAEREPAGRAVIPCRDMDAFMQWLTPGLIIAVFAWLRADIRNLKTDIGKRIDGVDKRIDGIDKRLDGVNARIDGLNTSINARLDGLNASVNARIDNAVRELRGDIAGVNARIDAVLLADRDRGRQDRGAA